LLAILLAIVSRQRWALPGECGEWRRQCCEQGLALAPVGSCEGLSAPSSELMWRGDTGTVVGVDSRQRIKPRELVVGGRYLQRNGLCVREITEISGNMVGYLDGEGRDRWCSNSVFVRACPTVATPEDEARVAEESRKFARLTDKREFTIRDEANALTACAFRNGFLEELHAGKPSDLLTQPGLSRISDDEMRKLMIQASAKLEELLRLKSETPAKYEEWVRDYSRRYCRSWKRD
jgi:hypothetical protein